jgi:uncharacterized protein YndB with AHSA1/START domain
MPENPQNPPSGGFTVRRRLPATAERVYAAFVEPTKLEQWFVVPGFSTPADRMRVDARPGGRVEAVMVAEADGSEIPFGFEYGELVPARLVTLLFNQPRERVVVTLNSSADGSAQGVDLVYEFVSWPAPKDEAASRRGVEDMLDRIEDGARRGTI